MRTILLAVLIVGIFFPSDESCWALGRCNTQPIGKRHGQYLGETPPGIHPKVFAPGVVTSDCSEHSVPVFSPDGREAFWTRMVEGSRKARLLFTSEDASGWTEPRIADFITGSDAFYPFFSADGAELYYVSPDWFGRSLKVSHKIDGDWTRPEKVGSPLKDGNLMWSASISATGTFYFGMLDDERQEQIYRVRRTGEGYDDAELLTGGINHAGRGASTPFIAPDESYLLFSSMKPGGVGMWDLYVSFPSAGGSWSDAYNLGPLVNSGANEDSPVVTGDGKYLFFIRSNDVFWVDAEIIDRIRVETSSWTK